MKLEGFIYIPEARLTFTRKEVDDLMVLSQRHYDGTCKQASEPGGFLYGMRNLFLLGDTRAETIEARLPQHEVDLLGKICETEGLATNPSPGLWFPLLQVLKQFNEEYRRLNPAAGDHATKL